MSFTSTRTVVVLAILLHYTLAYGQNPDCPAPTFFKTLGFENKSEFGTVLAKSSDGNLYLAGRNGNKTFIQKTNLAGREIWMREFQASQFESIDPVEIIEDSDGMIVGCGTQNQFAGARRGFVFRYDPAANVFLWAHPISSNNPTAGGILEKTPGGSFIYYQNPMLANQETDIEIFDLERATGNVIPAFASRYEHISSDKLTRMISVNGSLFGLGSSVGNHDTSTVARRMLLARFDPTNGNPIWAQLSHQDTVELGDQYGRDMIVDEDALVVAYIGSDSPLGGYRLYLQKSDLDGNIIWVRRYATYNSVLKLINVPDGYIVYGNRLDNEHVVHKLDKNGITQWSKRITQGVLGLIDESGLAPNLGVAAADSLYFTGIAQNGITDVFFWKLLTDGTMVDSCGFAMNTDLLSTEFLNPVKTPIDLKKLISTAVFSNVNPAWTTNSLEEQLLCPDCTIPDPCPEDNDFKVEINTISCSGGFVNMSFTICELAGGELPDLSVSFYNSNPFTTPADRLGVYNYSATSTDSCATLQLTNLESLFGTAAVQNGFQLFALVNDPGTSNTPISGSDFPLSSLEECAYLNNLDSFTVQLPGAPSLNLGPDQTICSNETALINAGAGFFKYQWSTGATTQSILAGFSGQYGLTVTDACGFRQTDTVNVVVKITPFVSENAAFCPGKSVTVRGFTFNQSGTFQETIPGIGPECDTVVTFFISKLPYEERIEVVYICPFSTVTINGVVYEDSGLVRDTVSSDVTCDTIVFYFITQLPLPFRILDFDLCPGESLLFNGQVYDQATSFTDTLYSSGFGCDTIAYVTIDLLPQPEKVEFIQFCPGTSVVINGIAYTLPGEVKAPIPSITGGCDTLVTYTLEWLPAPELQKTVQFCPGGSVVLGGQSYSQPGTVLLTIPGTGGGCDTLVTYTLQFGPSPTAAKTLNFCQGESIVLGGQTYTQPGTVTLLVPSSNGSCDTLVTYTLQYLTPPPSTMNLVCPLTVTVATTPGTGPAPVTYNAPVLNSNCECPGNNLTLTSGPASGSLFPVGNTQVCYKATDLCGSVATCCFTVTVREELPCDTKTNGCIKYDLLGITANAQQQRTYRIRVTNNCTSALIYTAIQLPDGISAMSPANFSTYTSPDGRKYEVRNPNYSPFYSIRFKSTNDSISNGGSDVFEYTLPAQVNPTFINITSRLVTQNFYAAHLNTFNCPIGVTPSQNRNAEEKLSLLSAGSNTDALLLFPNPSSGELFADLSPWLGEDLNIQVLDSRGMRIQTLSLFASSEAQSIPLASAMPSGLYFLEIATENGKRKLGRFMIER
jgi:hypothetical protein